MPTANTTSTPQRDTESSKSGRGVEALVKVGRLLVMAFICGVAIWSFLGIRSLVQQPQRATHNFASENTSAPLTASRPFGPGFWTFDTSCVRVEQKEATNSEIDLFVAGVSAMDTTRSGIPVSEELLELVSRLGLVETLNQNCQLITYATADVRLKAVLREQNEEVQLLAARFAQRDGEEHWQLMELIPEVDASFENEKRHAIDLPRAAEQLCARWTDDQRPIFEIVKIDMEVNELKQSWELAGWQVKNSRAESTSARSWLCQREGTEILVWSPGTTDRVEKLIITMLEQP